MVDTAEEKQAMQVIRRVDKLRADRGTLDDHLQQVAERVIPKKSYVTTHRTEGIKTIEYNSQLFDATAVFSNQNMAAGLVSHLAPANSRWFALKAKDPEQAKNPAVMESLSRITTLVHEELAISNFNNIISEVMTDLGWAGTACMEPKEGKKTALTFKTYHISEFYLVKDSDGNIDTVYYVFKYTARQAKQEWGDDA